MIRGWAHILTLWVFLVAPARSEGGGTRSLLQDVVKLNCTCEGNKVFSQLRSGQTVVLKFKSIKLSDTWVIDEEDVKVKGGCRKGLTTIVECPKDKPALLIRASRVVVENIAFNGCDGNNSTVIVEPKKKGRKKEVMVSSVLFSGVEFRNNSVRQGYRSGGTLVISNASVSIENSVFDSNAAGQGFGGAVSVFDGLLSVHNSTFRNNSAGNAGGAIFFRGQPDLESDPAINSTGVLGLNISDCTFKRNRARSGSRRGAFQDVNDTDLEKLVFYAFDNVAGGGGAITINGSTGVVIEKSRFFENGAPSGGALYIEHTPGLEIDRGAVGIAVIRCSFSKNAAVFPVSETEGTTEQVENLLSGGAVFAVHGEDGPNLSFKSCNFTENHAVFGGGLHLIASDAAEIEISDCVFENNAAKKAGGGAVLRNAGNVRWSNTHVRGCSAEIGGGVLLTNNAKLNILGPDPRGENGYTNSIFEGNVAVDGAGLMCALCGASEWQSPWFIGNKARRNGGGVAIIDAVTDITIQQGNFTGNIARKGGGVHVDGSRALKLFSPPSFSRGQFSGNRAVSGAGLLLVPRRNRIEMTNMDFEENEAVELDALLADLEEVNATIAKNYNVGSSSRKLLQDEAGGGKESTTSNDEGLDCGPAGGGGLCVVMDKISEASSSTVTLSGLDMIGNKAGVGGGAYIRVAGFEWQSHRCPRIPTATSDVCRSFEILNSTFEGNIAQFTGAGLFVSDPKRVSLIAQNDTDVKILRLNEISLQESKVYGLNLTGNSLQRNGGSTDNNNVGSNGFGLLFDPPIEFLPNQTSGLNMTTLRLHLLDASDQPVTEGHPDAEAEVTIKSNGVTGKLVYKADKGIVTINETKAVGNHTNHIMEFFVGNVEAGELEFSIRNCFPGEMEGDNFQDCTKCGLHQYSFFPGKGCRHCEEKAICPGGASLVPVNGYWHSTPYSPHFHQCIIQEACEYEHREELLVGFYYDMSKLVPNNRSIPNEEYKQCAEGYKGVLCGSCQETYGHFSGGQCKECRSVKGTVTIIVLGLLWSLVLVGFEIMSNISANKDFFKHFDGPRDAGNGNIRSVHEEDREEEVVAVSVPEPEGATSTDGDLHIQVASSTTQIKSAVCNIPRNVEAAEKLTETFKIFVNYLQVTSLAVTVNLSWAEAVRTLLQIQEFAAGLSGGSAIAPLDCTFKENLGTRSIIALWFRILYPIILLCIFLTIVVSIWAVVKAKQLFRERVPSIRSSTHHALRVLTYDNLATYSIIVTVAVAFFAYNGVTEELLRTVNCIELKKDYDPIIPEKYAALTALPERWVWAEDTALTCFHGKHTLTGVLGVVLLFFFSIGFAVGIWGLLKWKRHKDPNAIWEVKFLSRFGFLYRSYRTDGRFTIYWEAVVTLRKALMGIVVVYAYPLGPNLQAVLALGVLIVAMTLQLLNKPYRNFSHTRNCGGPLCKIHNQGPTLNQLETMSLFMSLIAFYSGIIFNDENTSEAGKILTTTLIVISHSIFMMYMMSRIWGGLHVLAEEKTIALDPRLGKLVADQKCLLTKVFYLIRISMKNDDWEPTNEGQASKQGEAA